MTKPDVFAAACALERRDREELLTALVSSLDDELSETELKALWIEESARRAREIIDGEAEEIPGDEVMAQARALLA